MAPTMQEMRDALYEPTWTEICEGDEVYAYESPYARVFEISQFGGLWFATEYVPTGGTVEDDPEMVWPAVQSQAVGRRDPAIERILDTPNAAGVFIRDNRLERIAEREAVQSADATYKSLDEALEAIRSSLDGDYWFRPSDEPVKAPSPG